MKTNTPRLAVVIIDAEPMSRRGLIDFLKETGAYTVRAAVATLEEAAALLLKAPGALVVVDIAQDAGAGLAFISQCQKLGPKVKAAGKGLAAPVVLVWSNREDYDTVRDAFLAGAVGYVSKRDGEAELLKGLEEALTGERHMGPRIEHRFLKGVVTQGDRRSVKSQLSRREWEVFGQLSRLDTAKDIAAALGISQKTVETHIRRMCEKLKVRTRRELLRLAIRELGDGDRAGEAEGSSSRSRSK